MPIRAVFLDVGETLVDETRQWGEWADWLGVGRLTLFAALGATIERGRPHQEVFQIVRPGIDLQQERLRRAEAGVPDGFRADDLYPDAVPCLQALRAEGYLVGLAGNQPLQAEDALRSMGISVDVLASSARWGVEKPSRAFFERVVSAAGCLPHEVAYVGDRLDNDVLPAREAGMVAVFLRRGPWGFLHAQLPGVEQAHLRLESLAELPSALRSVRLPTAPPRP